MFMCYMAQYINRLICNTQTSHIHVHVHVKLFQRIGIHIQVYSTCMYAPEDQQVVVHVPQVAQYSLSEKLATGLPAGEWNGAHSDH